ncbi:MAG: lambda-exonuclease family protein [Betaproteobacteria bacterium]
MTAIVKLAQGSPEWHEHRNHHRNASETPAVLDLSPWVTPYQLWLQRMGRAEARVNPAMLRGSQLEPLARAAYENLTDLVMQPLVLVDGDYSASLDGLTLDQQVLLEIKCPARGKDSELWKRVELGQLPEHYVWQVQHQLMVAKAGLAHVYVFDGIEGILLEQRPDPERWSRIRTAWDEFTRFMVENRPPPLTERDTLERLDPDWRLAAEGFVAAKDRADQVNSDLDAAKRALIALATHPSERGFGVLVTRYWKAGSVDYKQIPQIASIDLDLYRAAPREEVRVTLRK